MSVDRDPVSLVKMSCDRVVECKRVAATGGTRHEDERTDGTLGETPDGGLMKFVRYEGEEPVEDKTLACL